MTLRLLCVGKLKERYLLDAAADYVRRLSRFSQVEIVEVPDEKTPDAARPAEQAQAMAREGERLLLRIGPGDYVIALCVEGKPCTSETFAMRISALRDAGRGALTFVIGGSMGLSDAVKRRADERLSLSMMTLPHRLARIVLLEQLYRAEKINAHETYHK